MTEAMVRPGWRRLAPVLALGLLVWSLQGCASTPSGLYDWGQYPQRLHQHYHEPDNTGALQTELERLVDKWQQTPQYLPPGLYAELATLYWLQGQRDDARRFFELEYQAWPESRPFMRLVLDNLESGN